MFRKNTIDILNYNKIKSINESNTIMTGQDAQKLNLVFSGGGARGVAYVGAYAALQDAQVMDQVQQVSGISAGSIMATMVALGVKPELVREQLFEQDFPSLLGERTRRRQPFSIRLISKEGLPLIRFVNQVILTHLKDYFQNLPTTDRPEIEKLRILVQAPNSNFQLNFEHLEQLHQFNPQQFKRLYIAASDKETNLIHYNYQSNATTPIAEACRASASLPVIFTPYLNQEGQPQFDGGLHTNFLTEPFGPPPTDKDEESKEQTLVFGFAQVDKKLSELDGVQRIAHAKPISEKEPSKDTSIPRADRLVAKLIKILGINGEQFARNVLNDQAKLRARAYHLISLQVGDIEMTDFKRAHQQKDALEQTAYVNTMSYLRNYNLTDDVCLDSVMEALEKTLKVFPLDQSTTLWLEQVKKLSQQKINQYQDINKFRSIYPKKILSQLLTLIEQYHRNQITQLELTEQLYVHMFERSHVFALSKSRDGSNPVNNRLHLCSHFWEQLSTN